MKHELSKERLDVLIKTAQHMIERQNTSDYSENIRAIAEIALGALLAAHEQEPVAWRYRFVHTPKSLEHGSYFTTDWVLTESEDDCNPSDCFERQPLYAHPAPSIQAAVPDIAEAVREALDRVSCPDAYMRVAVDACHATIHPAAVPEDEEGNSPEIHDGWIPVSERLPDPESEYRVCVYTPTPHEDVRYRFVPASLFRAVCRDATHWQYMNPPAAPNGTL